MEGNLRKRFSLSSWMTAGAAALGLSGLLGASVSAATINDVSTSLNGIYGTEAKVHNLDPGANPDVGMPDREEDLYQFTGTNFTVGSEGGQTIFTWKTSFGERGTGDDVTMDIVGGTNIFDNQGIYIGARAEGNGGAGTLNIQNGNNIFTQRLILGGEGMGENGVTGRGSLNIANGTNIFTYNKKMDWQEIVTVRDKAYQIKDFTGDYYKHLGNGVYANTAKGDANRADGAYGSVNMYNYYNNYYGVFIGALGEGGQTEGADLNISGGRNIFNVATYIGGGYDLTPYGSVNTSSDDNDVVKGGTNLINISGGFNNFASRTYFGAQESSTELNFSGRGTTYFMGTNISEDMDLAMANTTLEVPGSYSSFSNSYKGGDLPYAFIGGKDGTAVMNINGFNSEMTTVDFQTTAFFGGADERWLAGDQYRIEDVNGDGTPEKIYNFRDGEWDTFKNGIRQDKGVATVNLNSGKLKLGYVNTTPIVAQRNVDNWNYNETQPQGVVYEPTWYQQRYEQVRLIGAAPGSTFNANGGRIQFDVAVHAEQAEIIKSAKNEWISPDGTKAAWETVANGAAGKLGNGQGSLGYSGYFTEEVPNYVKNANGEDVLVMEAGMIAFDKINISANTDITLGGLGNIMVRSEMAPAEGEQPSIIYGKKEFYTTPVFVDTSSANFVTTDVEYQNTYNNEVWEGAKPVQGETSDVTVDMAKSAANTTDSFYGQTVYDKWLYTLTLEDADPNLDTTTGIDSNQVRFHVQFKGLDENLVGNMADNRDTFKELLLNGNNPASEHYAPQVYDAVEQIISNSKTAGEAAENFDQLVGAGYGNYVASQIRRISTFNTMLTDQIVASDICLKNLRGNPQRDECGNCRNWTAWAHYYADSGFVNQHNYISEYDTNTTGVMAAIDWTNCESAHFGMFFDYAHTDVASHANMGYTAIESDHYTLGLYAKWLGLMCTGGYGSLIASVSWSDMDSTRELYLDDSFKGSTNGTSPSIFYERGWVFFPHDKLSINPYFGLQYVYFGNDAFTEEGWDEVGDPSYLALKVNDIDHHSLRTLLGLRISRDWMLGSCQDRRLTTRFKGAWMHDLLSQCDPTYDVTHTGYSDFPAWTIRGNNSGRDWAILGVGADFNASSRISFLVDYNLYLNEFTTIHAGMATMRFSF